jgi:hypothetical protein
MVLVVLFCSGGGFTSNGCNMSFGFGAVFLFDTSYSGGGCRR